MPGYSRPLMLALTRQVERLIQALDLLDAEAARAPGDPSDPMLAALGISVCLFILFSHQGV